MEESKDDAMQSVIGQKRKFKDWWKGTIMWHSAIFLLIKNTLL